MMGTLLAGRQSAGWELPVARMRTRSAVCVPCSCRDLAGDTRELPQLLGKDTRDGLGALPTWKLLSMVMRPVWESSYTAPGNVLSSCGCRSWIQCHLWVPSNSGNSMQFSYNSMQCYHFGFTLTLGRSGNYQTINCHLFS